MTSADLPNATADRRDSIRLAGLPPGGPGPSPVITRLRGRGEADLEHLPDNEADAGLSFPEGLAGEADRRLALADTAGAMSLAAQAMGAAVTDEATPLSEAEAAGRCVMARALLMEGRVDPARAALGSHRSSPRMALADAAVLLAEGTLDRAEARIQQALTLRPTGVSETYVLALIRVTQGDTEAAIKLLKRVSASAPEHAVARHQLGKLIQAEGDPARAGTLYEMAWELAPDFVGPALAMAEMFTDSRQYGEAMNILAVACDRAPNLLSPRLMQLRILIEARRIPAALQLAEALMTSAPDREDITALWAEALLADERPDEARPAVEKMLTRGGLEDPAKLLRLMARMDLAMEPPRLEQALANLERAAKGAPDNGELLLELAQLQLAVKKKEDASLTLERLMHADVELGTVLSGAVMASKHGLGPLARRLGAAALRRVAGTPVEEQLKGIVNGLG